MGVTVVAKLILSNAVPFYELQQKCAGAEEGVKYPVTFVAAKIYYTFISDSGFG
jgi:hypothetical protein